MNYNFSLLYNPQLITFLLLLLCTISIWLKKYRHLWKILFIASIVSGFLTSNLQLIGILLIGLMGTLYYLYYNKISNGILKFILGIILTCLAIPFLLHKVPGFHNWKVIDAAILKDNAIPFTLYFNFDKQTIGILIIALAGLASISYEKIRQNYLKFLLIIIPGLSFVIFLGFVLHYVKYDPKVGTIVIIWSISNLFFTCVSEEAVFRGFVLKELNKMFKFRYGEYLAIIISTIPYSLIHYPGGIKYVFLAGVAGLVYGLVYVKTKQIEASILTHFLLNFTHIIFLTYPALMPN